MSPAAPEKMLIHSSDSLSSSWVPGPSVPWATPQILVQSHWRRQGSIYLGPRFWSICGELESPHPIFSQAPHTSGSSEAISFRVGPMKQQLPPHTPHLTPHTPHLISHTPHLTSHTPPPDCSFLTFPSTLIFLNTPSPTSSVPVRVAASFPTPTHPRHFSNPSLCRAGLRDGLSVDHQGGLNVNIRLEAGRVKTRPGATLSGKLLWGSVLALGD